MLAIKLLFLIFINGLVVKALPVNPSIVEGDIALLKQFKSLGESNRQWPNGVVPYQIDSSYTLNERNTILAAMQLIMTKTQNCIRFVPRDSSHFSWIYIQSLQGCYSYVGKVVQYGPQTVSLQRGGCVFKGTAVHELLHALGFWHEQNRPDRNSYVRINYENINPNAVSNFNLYYNKPTFGTPYDYYSIMHYDSYSFSVNGRPTIEPLQPGVQLIHSARKTDAQILSAIDVQAIRTMYQCSSPITTEATTRPTTTSRPTTTTRPTSVSTVAPFTPFTFTIINNGSQRLYLYWVDYRNRARYYGAIYPGRAFTQRSYTTNRWLLVTSDFRYLARFVVGEGDFLINNSRVSSSQLNFRAL